MVYYQRHLKIFRVSTQARLLLEKVLFASKCWHFVSAALLDADETLGPVKATDMLRRLGHCAHHPLCALRMARFGPVQRCYKSFLRIGWRLALS